MTLNLCPIQFKVIEIRIDVEMPLLYTFRLSQLLFPTLLDVPGAT